MPEIADEMNDRFRAVLEDVVDAQGWAGRAGPGARVRERGERRRRRRAATSVAGVAAVAVAAVAGSAWVAGGPGPAAAPGGNVADRGFVKLAAAMVRPGDLGAGFSASPIVPIELVATVPAGQRGAPCTGIDRIPAAGTMFHQDFDGELGGVPVMVNENLRQYADAGSAEQAFQTQRSTTEQGCLAGVRDISGVGDSMLIGQASWGAPARPSWIAVARVGKVFVEFDILPGPGQAVPTVSDSWLTGVMGKAVTQIRNAPRTDRPLTVAEPDQQPSSTAAPTSGSASYPVSQPVDGSLFAPADLGPSFTAARQDAWHTKQIPSATSVDGMLFRGTLAGGDNEFIVNEGVYRFADVAAAQSGFASYGASTTQTSTGATALPGLGDQAWIKHFQKGGATVAVRVGARVITFDVLAGGASADQPIPGGDVWLKHIAQIAVQRMTAGTKN